jgi:hypothetical protein
LIGFPSTNGDDLFLFSNGGIGTENIRLDGVGDEVNLVWVSVQLNGELFPEARGHGGFYG